MSEPRPCKRRKKTKSEQANSPPESTAIADEPTTAEAEMYIHPQSSPMLNTPLVPFPLDPSLTQVYASHPTAIPRIYPSPPLPQHDAPFVPYLQQDPLSASLAKKAAAAPVKKEFVCQGYPDCTMAFSRAEHLARHIRKHTGEKPFTCHCGKSFSRLDNLRQHAGTTHPDQVENNANMLKLNTELRKSMIAPSRRGPKSPKSPNLSTKKRASPPSHLNLEVPGLTFSPLSSSSSDASQVGPLNTAHLSPALPLQQPMPYQDYFCGVSEPMGSPSMMSVAPHSSPLVVSSHQFGMSSSADVFPSVFTTAQEGAKSLAAWQLPQLPLPVPSPSKVPFSFPPTTSAYTTDSIPNYSTSPTFSPPLGSFAFPSTYEMVDMIPYSAAGYPSMTSMSLSAPNSPALHQHVPTSFPIRKHTRTESNFF